jgi:transposase
MESEKWAEIRRLKNVENLSIRAIALRMGVNRRTVRRALRSASTPTRVTVTRATKLDRYMEYLKRRLEEYPELAGAKLLIEIKQMGYSGGYTQLKEYLSTLRPKAEETYLRLETLPGEQGQVDWANCGAIRVGTGTRKLSCFVMVLSYSRMLYLEFTLSQCLEDFLAAHVRAFRYFGGVPRKLLYDNLKTVVLSHVGREIRFNPKFMDFAGYYLFEPVACRPGKGNEKGKVENGIKYVRSSFLAGRGEEIWPEVNRDAARWRDETANVRIHGTTGERPVERFERERALLKPLSLSDYDTAIIRPVKATSQAFVIFDSNGYSVPWKLSMKTLTLKATSHEVRVYSGMECVAEHHRSYEKRQYIEKAEHRHGLIAARKAAYTAKLNDEFEGLGGPAQEYMKGLIHAEINLADHLKKIMEMVGLYGKTEVLGALEHALSFRAFGAPYIKNIILQRRASRGLDECRPIQLANKPKWTDLTVEEQDLSLYDDLFGEGSGEVEGG